MNNKAQILFGHYRQNLNMVFSDSRVNMRLTRDDIVICPLCCENWHTVEAIQHDLLTVEHVPPKSLGGKGKVLTCKSCNNTQGSSLDAPLAAFIRDMDALQGVGEAYVDGVWKTIDGGKVRIEFQGTEMGMSVNAVPKSSNILHVQSLIDQLEQGTLDEFKFALKLTDPKLAMIGILRSAYLLAFYYLGYGFLINPHLHHVRHQLQHPAKHHFPHNAVQFFAGQDVPDSFLGVNIIYEPAEWKSYLILFDVGRKGSPPYRVGVMLPGPNKNDYEFFNYIKSTRPDMTNIRIHHYDISFEDKLTTPFLGHLLWIKG